MPVRIRLAYHPLARRKEPYYHIVAAKSKTARQKKPLEVLGTYDPIPRHPQGPSGQILEDKPKVKKISMNVDRIKYWLSVGAQPSNHIARLLRKANLIPEEPPVQEKKKPLPLNNVMSKKARDVWAWQRQFIKEENKRAIAALKKDNKPTMKSEILPSTGAHIQEQITDVAHDLIGEVYRESLYKETIAIPGKPFLDLSIEHKSSNHLRKDFKDWLEWICPEDRKPQLVRQFQILLKPARTRAMPLRFFTAFFHLKPDLGKAHNMARFNLLIEWLDSVPVEQLQVYPRETLDNFVWKMMHQWHDAIVKMGSNRVLTEEEETLSKIIANRLELIRQMARSFKSQERELEPWTRLFQMESDAFDLANGNSPFPENALAKYFRKHAKEMPEDYDYVEELIKSDPSITHYAEVDLEPPPGFDPDNNDGKVYEEAMKKIKEEAEARKKEKEAKKAAIEEVNKKRAEERKEAKKDSAKS